MNYCDRCKASVTGSRRQCPLCRGELRAGAEPESEQDENFPFVPTLYRKNHLFIRFLILISIVAGVAALIVNAMLPQGGPWSLFAGAGIICTWAIAGVAVNKRRSIMKNVLWQVVILSLLAVLWDVFTGWRGWSLDYAVPLLCISAILAMAITAKVLGMRPEEYIVHLALDAVFGVVPVIFLLLGSLRVSLPSLICVGVSIIALAAIFLFEGDRMLTELRRRFHL